MKTIPILMQHEMVRAILDGRKTQTRRTKGLEEINKEPGNYEYKKPLFPVEKIGFHYFDEKPPKGKNATTTKVVKAKCSINDIFWVRETFGVEKAKYKRINYKAGDAAGNVLPVESWKPSIHMPKSACRIWLKVTDVRAERLQDIFKNDARKEGIPNAAYSITPVDSFNKIWESINGKNSWDINPWVWVYSSERCEMPEGFLKS